MTGKAAPGSDGSVRTTINLKSRQAGMVADEVSRTGDNVTDVINRAVLIMDFVLRAEREGKRLTLVDGAANSERIVILT